MSVEHPRQDPRIKEIRDRYTAEDGWFYHDVAFLLAKLDRLATERDQQTERGDRLAERAHAAEALEERQNWQVDVAEANAARMVADMAEAEVERLKATIARVEALATTETRYTPAPPDTVQFEAGWNLGYVAMQHAVLTALVERDEVEAPKGGHA